MNIQTPVRYREAVAPLELAKNEQTKQTENKKNLREIYNLPKGMTIDSAKHYFPNICKIPQEELFDAQFHSGVKLSNGATLLRPVILSLGDVDITKDENNLYTVKIRPHNDKTGERVISHTMSEEKLLKTRTLSKGLIREIGPDKYRLVFIDVNGKKKEVEADKKTSLKILKENLLYM